MWAVYGILGLAGMLTTLLYLNPLIISFYLNVPAWQPICCVRDMVCARTTVCEWNLYSSNCVRCFPFVADVLEVSTNQPSRAWIRWPPLAAIGRGGHPCAAVFCP
jgi:hypothetical protein